MAINYTKTNWVNGQAPAISATNLNKIEQGIKSACDGVDTLLPPSGSFIEQKTLLWENASPSSQFAGQTISLDLSDYDAVEIIYTPYAFYSGGVHAIASAVKGEDIMIYAQFGASGLSAGILYCAQRHVNMTNNGITFSSGYGVNTGNEFGWNQDDYACAPYKIYGIKRVEVA